MKRTFIWILLASCSIGAWALQVNNNSGALKDNVGDCSITQLEVTGTMDARDFKFIADSLNSLTSLDLSNVVIEEYSSDVNPVFFSVHDYKAMAIPPTAFFGMPLQQVTLPQGLKEIGEAAFAGCGALQSITVPESVEEIGDFAFSACNSLTSVTIPQQVEVMGTGVFARCEALTQATINATTVGKDAFMDCTNLSEVNLAAGVTGINTGAFAGTTALKQLSLPAGSKLEYIGQAAFAGSGLESINLTDCEALSSIGMWAFANSQLTAAALPEGVESVGDGAFYYNLNMEQVALPASLTTLSNYILAGNNKVATANPVTDGVTSIGDYAFYNWDQITLFNFPETVKYIGTQAMAGQTGLETVRGRSLDVPELGDDVWAGVNQGMIPLKVDQQVTEDYRAAEQWKEFVIVGIPTDIDETVIDAATVDIKAHFNGTTLVVNASQAIARVDIYDTRGVLLTTAAPMTTMAQLDTAHFVGKVYIVTVVLDNGSKKAFKLMRQ